MAQGALKTNGLGGGLIDVASPQLQNIQQGYGDLNATAQGQENTALQSLMDDLTSSNWDLATITDDRYMDLLPKYQQNADKYSGTQEQIANEFSGNLSSSNQQIRQILNQLGVSTDNTNQNLLKYKNSNSAVNDATNSALLGTLDSDQQATDDYTLKLSSLIGSNNDALDTSQNEHDKYIGQNNSALQSALMIFLVIKSKPIKH